MKGLKAHRMKFRVGEVWESPLLHILLTAEDDVIVARCLEFTVSSHGKDEKTALKSLAVVVKEYLVSAIENNALHSILDSAHSKYWRLYNELEAKQSINTFKTSLKKSVKCVPLEDIIQEGRVEMHRG